MQYLLTEEEFKKLDGSGRIKAEVNARMEAFFVSLQKNLRVREDPMYHNEKIVTFRNLQEAINVAREEAKT